MSIKIKHALSLVLLLLLVSCGTVGKPFNFLGPQSIIVGKTTKADVLKTYGEPFQVGYDSGDLKWTYGFYFYRMIGESETKDLIINFDSSNIVKAYSYTTSMKDEKAALLHKE